VTATRPRRAAGYVRACTNDDAQGRSLDDQRKRIRDFADREKLTIQPIAADGPVADPERSTRSGIFELIDAAPELGLTDVVVTSVDRILHDGEIGRLILKELEHLHINVVSLTEDRRRVREEIKRVITSSASALKSADTKIRALHRGKAPAGRAPYGYRRVPEPGDSTTRLQVVEEEAETVRWIFNEYLSRRSMAKVAKGLAKRGVPAPGGSEWSRASVAWILGNEVYIGMVKFGTMKGKGEHQPIIARDVFDSVQELRTANRRRRSRDGVSSIEMSVDDFPGLVREVTESAEMTARKETPGDGD
jgi:site-specific DNA recombinase